MKFIWCILFISALFGGINGKTFSRMRKGDVLYENKLYGFTLNRPKDWYAASPTELSHLIQMASSLIESHKHKFSHILSNWSVENITPLFGFSKYPLNATNGQLNPNILSMTENLNAYRNVKNPCDYFDVNQEILKTLAMGMKFIGTCQNVNINGENFKTHSIQTKIPNFPLIKQTFYAKIVKDNQLFLVLLTYFNRNSKTHLENIMKTLKFTKN
ncbi:unnamed protein product [Adineta ricciae]|uniref:Uncharacterized protein n=1 Tax=Adineta ricciae TaxID=249248 RepID=A0A815I3W3_ADIRI|nr:unnamed protein product [Adineta ricciae]CAF1362947.1 unnamed protein product [Adineta ricciae]